jgi:phosphatidylglycerophosphatase A
MPALDRLWTALATGFYLSYIPVTLLGKRKWSGAGFIGTLEGLLVVPFLPQDPLPYAGVLTAAVAASCWICGKAEKALGGHDDPRIVLDEVVGYWTAVAFLPAVPSVWLAGFVLFRFFDSFKFAPYSWLERLPGGLGVVGDDVGAGIAANVFLRIAVAVWPQLF